MKPRGWRAVFSALIMLGTTMDGSSFASAPARRTPASSAERPLLVPRATHEALTQALHCEEVFDFDSSEQIYLRLLREDDRRSARITAYLWFRLAYAQQADGNDTLALKSVGKALALHPTDANSRRLRSFLVHRREWPKGQSPTRYLARRDLGSAGRLVATNGILHIFVRGRDTDAWSDFDVAQAKFAIEQTTQWMNSQTQKFDVQPRPTFDHRYLMVPDEPFWRSVDVPGFRQSPDFRSAWEKAVLKRFSAASFAELFDQTFAGAPFRNRAVVFHANLKARAFAVPACLPSGVADLEKAFVYFPVTTIINPLQSVVYGHELMHLYGADDLYNKVDDPAAPDQELMKFGSYRLERCIVSPVTTYAVGWSQDLPQTTRLQILPSFQKKLEP